MRVVHVPPYIRHVWQNSLQVREQPIDYFQAQRPGGAPTK